MELKCFTSLVEIPDLEEFYTQSLEYQLPRINRRSPKLSMRTIYCLASVWPSSEEKDFLQLFATLPPTLQESSPHLVTLETVAAECALFSKIAAKGIDEDW